VADVNTATYDLSAKNPNKKEAAALRQPREILAEMKALDRETADILNGLMEMI
jgi:type I restriction enzyme M protein